MLVEDVMETDLVTCDGGELLRVAVEKMLQNRVGSVIVTVESNPTGILTETDVLLAGYTTEDCFGDIPVTEAMTQPLVTIGPAKSLRTAMRKMKDEEVKKLPVQDGIDLVGILTMTDINRQYTDIIHEIHAIEQPASLSDAELRGLESTTKDDH